MEDQAFEHEGENRDEEDQVGSVVSGPDAVVDPGTVVVEHFYALSAVVTMLGALGLGNLTHGAHLRRRHFFQQIQKIQPLGLLQIARVSLPDTQESDYNHRVVGSHDVNQDIRIEV